MNEQPEQELPIEVNENAEGDEPKAIEPGPSAVSPKSRRGLWLGITAVIILLLMAAAFVAYSRQQTESQLLQTTKIAIGTGAWETAVTEADQLLALQPAFLLRHTAEATGLRGVAHYHLGNLDEALADLNSALEADPNLVDLWAYRAAVHYMQGDETAALADTEAALAHTDLLPAHLHATLLANQAQVYAHQDENEKALAAADAALALANHLPVGQVAALYALQAQLQEAGGDYAAALESIAAAQSWETSLPPEQAAALAVSQTFILADQGEMAAALAASEQALGTTGLSDTEKVALHIFRAQQFYEQGELDTAVTEAQAAADLEGDLALPHALLAAQAYRDLDYETAAAEATTALEIANDDQFSAAIAHRVLGGTLTWQGNAPAALAELDTALAVNPEDMAALALRVYNRQSVGDHVGAIEDGERAISLAPDAPDALWAQAMNVMAFEGDYELGTVLMNQAITQEDGRPELYLTRSYSYRYTADDPKELADIQKALALAPDLPEAVAAELMYRYSQFEYGDGSELEALAQQFIEQYPEWDSGFSMLAQYHLDFSKDLEAALEYINQAIELRPEAAGNYALRGNIHLENNDLEAARADFEQALVFAPKHHEAFSGLSIIAAREDDLESSRTLMEQVIANSPRTLRGRVELASVLLDMGEMEEAWAITHRVLADDPEYQGALLMRAVLLGQMGQLRPSLADIERVLRRYPNHAFAHVVKSFTLLQLGSLDEAQEAAERALELDPSIYDAHRVLYSVASQQGDMAEAEAQLEQWLTAVPTYEANPELAGYLQLEIGLLAEGIESLTAALEEAPDDPSPLLFYRAQAQQQLGNIAAWQADMEEVLESATNLDLIADAEAQLAGNTVTQADDGRYRLTREDTGYTLTYGDIWTKSALEANNSLDLELVYETNDGLAITHVFSFIESSPTTLEEIVAIIDEQNANSPYEILSITGEDIAINGAPGHLIVYEYVVPDESGESVIFSGRQYIYVRDNIVILIRIEADTDLLPELEEEINTLANSFEWLE